MKVATAKTRIYLGVFVMGFLGILALCVVLAGDELTLFKRSEKYTADFTNAAGLIEGAPVRMGGVEVGRVDKIKIESRPDGLAIASTLRINSPYFELIRQDATVALDTQGLLGDKFVSLVVGSQGEPLAPGSKIKTAEHDAINAMVQKSTAIMSTVAKTTKKVDAFTEGLPDAPQMKAIGSDFAETARSLRILTSNLSSENSVINSLNDEESRIRLRNTLASLESAAAHADSVARKIDEGQGTIGALINDRTLYEDIRGILGHIDRGKIARRVFVEAGQGESAQAGR